MSITRKRITRNAPGTLSLRCRSRMARRNTDAVRDCRSAIPSRCPGPDCGPCTAGTFDSHGGGPSALSSRTVLRKTDASDDW